MRRRRFVALVGAAVALPACHHAQEPTKIRHVGSLSDETPLLAAETFEPFAQGPRELGWTEGQNIAFTPRCSQGQDEILPRLATDLVRLQPDVILAIGTPATRAVKTATQVVPIVFTRIADPIGLGLVTSLARPSGNVTGVSLLATDVSAKWLEFLLLAAPDTKRVGVIWDPDFPALSPQLKEIVEAARSLNLELAPAEVREPDDFEPALREVAGRRAGCVIVLPSPVFAAYSQRIAELMANAQLPAVFGRREHVDAGGLMSYGANFAVMYRRAAAYVDKILRGTKPADLPVEQPTKVELVINLKTANTLGLTIPPALLARADEVIE